MIVVDTNVLAYFFIPGAYTEDAERLFRRDPEWAAPILWRSEFRNVLAGYVNKKRMTLVTAFEIMEQAELLLSPREYTVPSAAVLELAAQSGCSAYDCEFVALARDLDISLFTSAAQILKCFPKLARCL